MSETHVTRRKFLALAGMGAAAAMVPWPQARAARRRKPNVIVILSDDHGYGDIGVQGCKDVPTPHIDSLAHDGIRFTDGYVSAPMCSPSRAGFMTGRYQTRFGHETNPPQELDRGIWGLPLNQETIADAMRAQGYATGAIGKWHLGDADGWHPNRRGFDEYFGFLGGMHTYLRPGIGWNRLQRNGVYMDRTEYVTDAFGREAASFIERHRDEPFFLYVAFNAVHAPLEPPERYRDAFPDITDPKRRRYAGVLAALDDNVGRILDKLRETGLEEDTLVVFLGDNGGATPGNTSRNDPFTGYKDQIFEGGIRVPFLARWTGTLPAGALERRPVISLDLVPTAVTLAGGTPGPNVEGVDLMPYLTGAKRGPIHEALYWRHDKDSAIRMGEWKLAAREGHGMRLYNLARDPGERTDLAAQQPDRVREMSTAWDVWNKQNIPPLWPNKRQEPWEDRFW
jgi:arylsulfatase A-like enzyme